MLQFLCIAIPLFFFVIWPIYIFGTAWLSIMRENREAKASKLATVHLPQVPSKNLPHIPPRLPPDVPPASWETAPNRGLAHTEFPGKNAKPQLKNSQFMEDLMQRKSALEQDIITMVQNGSSLGDIRRRHGREEAEKAQSYVDTIKAELKAEIVPMLEAGMTREQIIESLRSDTSISTTVPPDLAVEIDRVEQSPQHQQLPTFQPTTFRRWSDPITSEANTQSIPDPSPASEGGRKPKTNYAVVRSAKLRKAAIQIHGRNCSACGFNFDETFGQNLSQGYIEIHHLNSIAAGVRNTDPSADLAPLCGNCHAMADRLTRHHPSPPRSIGELKKLLFPVSCVPDLEVPPADQVPKSPVKVKIGNVGEKKPKKVRDS